MTARAEESWQRGSVRRRLDAEMVRRGLVSSRTQAVAAIDSRQVLVRGAVADKAARLVDAGDAIVMSGAAPRFVSRGGLKLEGALERFSIDVRGIAALDAGASTGGFTDCLLQRGARHVISVDVGIGQLHEKIRGDSRVEVHERCNVRTDALRAVMAGRAVPLVVGDLSFISLTTVAPSLLGACAPNGALVLLIKPQFEAGRAEVSRGRGVVRSPQTWARVLHSVVAAYGELGAAMMAVMTSPITGADGNVEFLAHFALGSSFDVKQTEALIEVAVLESAITHAGAPVDEGSPDESLTDASSSDGSSSDGSSADEGNLGHDA